MQEAEYAQFATDEGPGAGLKVGGGFYGRGGEVAVLGDAVRAYVQRVQVMAVDVSTAEERDIWSGRRVPATWSWTAGKVAVGVGCRWRSGGAVRGADGVGFGVRGCAVADCSDFCFAYRKMA
jgi:hypothetical protein